MAVVLLQFPRTAFVSPRPIFVSRGTGGHDLIAAFPGPLKHAANGLPSLRDTRSLLGAERGGGDAFSRARA